MSSEQQHKKPFISLDNYEEFFLLYIDHELSESERKDVESFLEKHPALQEELDHLLLTKCKPELLPALDKRALFKNHVDADNVEYLQLLFIDNELDETLVPGLEEYMNVHPASQKNLQLLQQTKLPLEQISFPHKEKLLKNNHAQTIILRRISYSIAASLVLFLGLRILVTENKSTGPARVIEIARLSEDSRTASIPGKNSKIILAEKTLAFNKPKLAVRIFHKINNLDKDKIFVVTVFKKSNNNEINLLQKRCILENINNKDVNKILIIGYNLEYELKELLESYNNKIIIKNVNNNNNNDNNISFKDIINCININCINNIAFLLRSDIVIPNQLNLDFVDLKINNKEIYALSRLDRLTNGNIIKSNKLNSLLFSTEQDAWIFNVPIKFKNKSLQKLEHIYFYDKYSHLYFNKIIIKNNYLLINNSKKYKIIRLMFDNNIFSRIVINNSEENNIDAEKIYLLPSNDIIDHITIEQLINSFSINDNEIYSIKCYLFNKYFKNKIISNI